MVKFGEQLQNELIPEWQEAYCSYDELKNDLKRIRQQRTMGPTYTRTGSLGLMRSLVSFKPTLSQTLTRRGRPDYMVSLSHKTGHSKDAIVINKRPVQDGVIYVTELKDPLAHSPQDRTFFTRLDAQLNKVNTFYKKKEAENIARAGALEKQMLALINLEEAMALQGLDSSLDHLKTDKGAAANSDDHHQEDSKETSDDDLPLIPDDTAKSDGFLMRAFSRKPSIRNQVVDDDEEEDEDDNAIKDYIDEAVTHNLKSGKSHHSVGFQTPDNASHSAPLHVGFQTPDDASASTVNLRSALKKVSTIPEPAAEEDTELEDVVREDDIENQMAQTLKSRKELDQARVVLRRAFLEFYRGLALLSNYRSLNITAFAKIMKKYDKVTGWSLAPIYMKEVESSYFVISKKIHKLMTKVEEIYTKHFSDGERKKALSQLAPKRKQGTHRTTFFLGLFTGSSIALFTSFFFLVSNPLTLDRGGGKAYLDTVFPVFSTLMLITIHIFFYAFDVYSWQRTRINYPFIFGFSPGTELRYREVLLLSTGFTTFLLGGMNIHIAVTLLTHPDHKLTDIIPLILVLVSLATLFLPFNIMYRSSRAFFLGCFRRLIIAPFIKVILSDFFLGDQLTSQVLVFRNFEFIACYYSSGFFLTKQDLACKENSVYRAFGYVVALLPYWWRFLQCLRRYYDEKDTHQLENAGKYMSAIVAVGLRQAYTNYRKWPGYELPLRVSFILTSIIATIFANYWDLCIDWGLLKSQSKNKWLRDKLILKTKSIYFVAIGVNSLLRLAWLATLLQVEVAYGFNQNAFDVIMASLEVIRRGIWNFFRIENEHLNNVGKYRAEKSVPLPFNDEM